MNPIAEKAKQALTQEGFPTRNNQCQKWARMVVQATEVGHQYDGDFQKETAKLAALSMLKNHPEFTFRYSPGMVLQPGDLCYKTVGSGGSGHVGIYIGNSQIAENSSVHWKETGGRDARGIRSLADFGNIDVVVRFPVKTTAPQPEKPKETLFLINNRIIPAAHIEGGKLMAPVVDVLDAVGFEIEKYNDRRAERGRLDIRAVPTK